MNGNFSAFLISVIAVGALACTEESSDGEGGGGSGATGSGAGPVCYDVEVNDTDGESACGPVVCEAGTYCFSTVGNCDPGCRETIGCPRDEFCDLSNATDGIGLCKKPGKDNEVECPEGGNCDDRCRAKAGECGAPANITEQGCDYICPKASESQVECLESSSCADLGEAFERGSSICGIEAPE